MEARGPERPELVFPAWIDVLAGGLASGHVFLLEGNPGTGKTTVALRFLMEGAKAGEPGLYITLSEKEEELRAGAASHGWPMDGKIEVFELAPPESLLDTDQQQSLLYSSDLELGETTKAIFTVFKDQSKAGFWIGDEGARRAKSCPFTFGRVRRRRGRGQMRSYHRSNPQSGSRYRQQ